MVWRLPSFIRSCIVVYVTVWSCNVLFDSVWFSKIWYGPVCYSLHLCGLVQSCMVLFGPVRLFFGLLLFYMVKFDPIYEHV